MASYSTNLLLSLLAVGESGVHGFANWGEAANSNYEFLEDTVSEAADIPLAGTNVTLTAAQERALYLNLSGTLSANVEVRTNDRKGFWFVNNGTSGAYTVTVKPTSGSGVVVQQSTRAILYCDGTNIVNLSSAVDIDSGSIDGTPIGGTTPSTGAFTTLTANGVLTVNSGSSVWANLGASSVASSYMTLNRSTTLGGVLGYIGTDGGAAIGGGTGTGLAVRSEADLILASGAAEAVRINSSQQVGIGTDPSAKLHVYSGATDEVTRFEGTGSPYISIYDSGSRAGYLLATSSEMTIGGDAGPVTVAAAGAVYLLANGATRMAVDTSGRVTMPYQPAFYAYKSGAAQNATGVVEFANVKTNIGSCYNSGTYRFTAPVAGTYYFFANWFADLPAANDYAYCAFYKNGANTNIYSHTPSTAAGLAYIRVPASATLTLAAGDYVDFRLVGVNGTAGVYGGSYSEFGGWLIG